MHCKGKQIVHVDLEMTVSFFLHFKISKLGYRGVGHLMIDQVPDRHLLYCGDQNKDPESHIITLNTVFDHLIHGLSFVMHDYKTKCLSFQSS